MKQKSKVREMRWILFQNKNGRYYLGVVLKKTKTQIAIIGQRDIKTIFQLSDISIKHYKENIYFISINEIIKKYPKIDAKITTVIETIKKHRKYDMILTNNKKFTKTNSFKKVNKIQKDTLWKKTYKWLKKPKKLEKFSPIVFFKDKNLEFLIIIDTTGSIRFIDKNFNDIKKIKNKHLNILLKKTKSKEFQVASSIAKLAYNIL